MDKIKLDDLNIIFLHAYIKKLHEYGLDTFGCDENNRPYDVIKLLLNCFDLTDIEVL